MISVEHVVVLDPVAGDLCAGKDFYDQIKSGVGDFLWDSLMADIRSLNL